MSITDYKDKEQINEVLMLKKFELRESRNGKKYADITLSDSSADISAKIWDVSNLTPEMFSGGMFVEIKALCETYNGKLQLIINSIKQIEPTDEQLSGIIETAPFPAQKMYDKIIEIINTQISNSEIQKLTLAIFEDKREKLLYYPAAKSFHHAMKAGLLYHTYTMLRSAKQLLEIYGFLNKDLVYAGTILHDIGKLTEMESDTNGTITAYSKEGLLLGHIISGICEIDKFSAELGISSEVTLMLKHIVLSHHLVPEFGSPKPPMIPEAEMIHYLDELDSRMNQMEKTLRGMQPGTFAERVFILDNRTLYDSELSKEND